MEVGAQLHNSKGSAALKRAQQLRECSRQREHSSKRSGAAKGPQLQKERNCNESAAVKRAQHQRERGRKGSAAGKGSIAAKGAQQEHLLT